MKKIVAANKQDMARKAASIIAAQVLLKEDSVLGLATGSTPLGVYEQLVAWNKAGDISFAHTRTVNLDEYCDLSGESEHSYRYYMNTNLFDRIDINKSNTHLPNGKAADFEEECIRYNELIDAMGGIDLQLLGIGHNGHIGFNEPSDAFVMRTNRVILTQSTREANAIHFPGGINEMPTSALTMGMLHIMQAKRVLLVAGPEKKDILQEALYGPVTPKVPASILQLHKRLTVVCC